MPLSRVGLRPGQSLAAAQMLSRAFCHADVRSGAGLRAGMDFLAAWAYRFSSHVSLHYPRALVMEGRSSFAHMFEDP